ARTAVRRRAMTITRPEDGRRRRVLRLPGWTSRRTHTAARGRIRRGRGGTEDGRALAAGQPQASRPGVLISSTCRRTVPSSAAPSAAATGRSAGWRGRRVSRAGRARKTGGSWRQGRFPANGQYWVRGDNFPPGQEPAPGYGILCGTADDLEPAGVQER